MAFVNKISGIPTYSTFQMLKGQLKDFAISLKKGGHAQYGYANLVLTDDEYVALAGKRYVMPVCPDAPDFSKVTTGDEVTIINAVYSAKMAAFTNHHEAETALMTALKGALNDDILAAVVCDPVLQGASVFALLQYLEKEFATMSTHDLLTNERSLSAPIDLDESLIRLWTRIQNCMDVARNGQQPILESKVVTTLLESFRNTGVFALAIAMWESKHDNSTDWTMAAFKVHFNKHNDDRRKALQASAYQAHGALGVPPVHTANAAKPNDDAATIAKLTAEINKLNKKKQRSVRPAPEHTYYYCHTHGYRSHDGSQCSARSNQHRAEATHDNIMGGSTAGQVEYQAKISR